ncbi:MAG: DUF3795 domain-containing protein [Firmicutes bacterium]|nr:DUF3795 domain-containing protein [Bacillota bacterium]
MGNRPPLDASLIAPCGMNCGICLGYLRDKNHCPGCRGMDNYKNVRCVIRKCEHRQKTESGFCSECGRFPCARMKQLDKRYRTRYAMSMFANLIEIKEAGMDEFIRSQVGRYTCKDCGGTICVHRGYCWSCKGKG